MPASDKVAPHSVEMERTVLGAILLEPEPVYETQATLAPHDFFLDSHQRIYRAMLGLSEEGAAVDLITVANRLETLRELADVGGRGYLASLTEGIPRRIAIADYLRGVKERSQARRILTACNAAAAQCMDGETPDVVIGSLQDGIQEVLDDTTGDEPLVSGYSAEAVAEFDAERTLERAPGLSYGIPLLDDFSGGMRPGEVTIVGARSGVGKTSLMCQAAAANCMAGVPVHLFSLEMTRKQILRRLWAIVSGVPYKLIAEPWRSSLEDAARARAAAAKVAAWPLRIHDQSELHLSRIVGLARVSMRRHGTRFIAVDYAQEVEAEGKDERMKVMAVAKRLSQMVKHENASLMLLSQLVKMNRESYNKPPMVGDLVESGKLENVAHIVVLLHRGWDEEQARISDEAQIIVPKQRRGETGVIPARFDRRSVTFT